MPDEEKKTVDIDTSGPDATVDIEEQKDESVVETEAPKQETETEEPVKQESQDDKLEEYSKGVQARIAKLTRKMREAERREQAAKRRKSFCARSAGQMKKFPKAAADPNSRLRQARRRWKC